MDAREGGPRPAEAEDALDAARGIVLAAMLSTGIWLGLLITLWTVW